MYSVCDRAPVLLRCHSVATAVLIEHKEWYANELQRQFVACTLLLHCIEMTRDLDSKSSWSNPVMVRVPPSVLLVSKGLRESIS